MDDVKTRLAAAGWSDKLRSGVVIDWHSNGRNGSCGIVEYFGVDYEVVPCSWDADGKMKTGRGGDLVSLPAPVQCPPVQKLATSGPSITRPVPAVDAWVTPAESSRFRYRVSTVETVNGETHIISGTLSVCHDSDWLTGPSDRGPWRPIGDVR